MPFYDFLCLKCGNIKEVSLSMNADKKNDAPKCKCTGKNIKMLRLFSAQSIIIKGRNITISDLKDKYDSKK